MIVALLCSLTAICISGLAFGMGFWNERKSFVGKHALITGGSAGIGFVLAEELLKQGAAHVTIAARSQSKLTAATDKLKLFIAENGLSSTVLALVTDVTVPAQVEAMVAVAEKAHGPIQFLVCNAGCSTPGRVLEQDVEVFKDTMDVNYFGVLNTIKSAVPRMVERGEGSVIIVASVMAIIGFTGYGSYAPTKWAVRGLADCLRNEVAGSGVSIHVAYPPDTDTPGFSTEKNTMPKEGQQIQSIAGGTVFSAEKVAQCMLKGVQGGSYHLRGPDIGLNVMVSHMAGYSPRMYNVVVDLLLAPLMVLFARLVVPVADRVVRKCRQKSAES